MVGLFTKMGGFIQWGRSTYSTVENIEVGGWVPPDEKVGNEVVTSK